MLSRTQRYANLDVRFLFFSIIVQYFALNYKKTVFKKEKKGKKQ